LRCRTSSLNRSQRYAWLDERDRQLDWYRQTNDEPTKEANVTPEPLYTEPITADEVIQALRELVHDPDTRYGPDYADPNGGSNASCRYYYPDTGLRCIAGEIIYRLRQVQIPAHYDDTSIHALTDHLLPATSAARHLLQRAQHLQDRGMVWGDVLTSVVASFEADATYREPETS
jgi:hypothetical protein